MKIFQYIVLLWFLVGCGNYDSSHASSISSKDLNNTLISQNNYFQSFGENNVSNKTFYTTKDNKNSVKVAGGIFTTVDTNISKLSDVNSIYETDFKYTNSALFVTNDGVVKMSGGFVKTDALGVNAIVVSNGEANISDTTIECYKSFSNGFLLDNKSLVNGINLKATISGENSSMIVYDKGNSNVKLSGGNLTLLNDNTPFISVLKNAKATTILDGTNTTIPSGILMKIDYKNRRKTDDTTSTLILSGSGTTYTGSVIAQKYTIAKVIVNESVAWQGAYDAKNTAKFTSLTINGGTWILSGDSNVDSITLKNGAVINKAGYSLTYTNLTNISGMISD